MQVATVLASFVAVRSQLVAILPDALPVASTAVLAKLPVVGTQFSPISPNFPMVATDLAGLCAPGHAQA